MAIKHTPRVLPITTEQAYALRDAVMQLIPTFAPRIDSHNQGAGSINFSSCRVVEMKLAYKAGKISSHLWLHFDFISGKAIISQFGQKSECAIKVGKFSFAATVGGDILSAIDAPRFVTGIKAAAEAATAEWEAYVVSLLEFPVAA